MTPAELLLDDSTQSTAPHIEPFRPFPIEALPKPIASFVRDCANAIGCDPSFIALPLLVGFASAIGNSRRIQLKRGWTEPAILWGAIIGESGSTKSPALELALRPLHQRQDRQMREYHETQDQWLRDKEINEVKKAAWKQEVAKAASRDQAPPDPPSEVEEPTCNRCWTDDATIEALAKLLQENPRGLLTIRDELVSWLHFDRYSKSGGGSEAGKWLEMFGGRTLVVDRKTSPTIYVPQAAVSIIGGIQPDILWRGLGQEHRDNGLLARLLLTKPPKRAKQWTDADIDPAAEAKIAKIFEALYDLDPASGPDGEARPAIIMLTNEGKQAWITFYNEHNQEQADLTGDLSAAWSKLEGYAARFALVHHLVRAACNEDVGNAIDAKSIEAGVTLSRWFGNEAKRVYSALSEDEESRNHRQLVEMIELHGGQVSIREWQRKRSHKKAKDAKAELEGLVEAGFGTMENTAPGAKGGRPTTRFVLTMRAAEDSSTIIPATTEPPSPENSQIADDEEWGEL